MLFKGGREEQELWGEPAGGGCFGAAQLLGAD